MQLKIKSIIFSICLSLGTVEATVAFRDDIYGYDNMQLEKIK